MGRVTYQIHVIVAIKIVRHLVEGILVDDGGDSWPIWAAEIVSGLQKETR
jgi:hypothetical protein